MNQMKSPWDEWFAGVIDGDGYFYINKKKKLVLN